MVLTGCHGSYGYEFAEGRKGRKHTDPDKDEAVDYTGAATVCQAGSEVHQCSFPGNKDGATKSEDGPASEVSLGCISDEDGELEVEVYLENRLLS